MRFELTTATITGLEIKLPYPLSHLLNRRSLYWSWIISGIKRVWLYKGLKIWDWQGMTDLCWKRKTRMKASLTMTFSTNGHNLSLNSVKSANLKKVSESFSDLIFFVSLWFRKAKIFTELFCQKILKKLVATSISCFSYRTDGIILDFAV